MKSLNLVFILSLLLCCLVCRGQNKPISIDTSKNDDSYRYNIDYDVSLVKLIANPEKFNGKHVRVIGFLNLEFEGNALYLHKDDYLANIFKNGLWVNINQSKLKQTANCNKNYVLIEGIFDAEDTGHMGAWSGAIRNVTRLDLWHKLNEKK